MKLGIFAQISAVLIGVVCAVHAQDDVTEKQEPGTSVFHVTTWGDWKGDSLYAKTKNGFQQIDLHHLSKSEGLPFKRAEGIALHLKETDADSGEDVFPVALKVKVPATMRIPLLLVTRVDEKLSYQLYDLSPENFPGGSYRFVNISREPILLKAGKNHQRIDPGKEFLVKGGFGDRKLVKLAVYLADENNKPKRVWAVDSINRKSKRMTMFFYPAKSISGRLTLRCKSMVDYLHAKEE
ncbi:hypothetical protein NT6N_36390 [Oceaniferula spumae]|uniref:DUF3108 domain-containing protein n=1 Tax=Oceaniferula spumae TaxID=2979115 RepID=A0AAT9FRS7_9BACT